MQFLGDVSRTVKQVDQTIDHFADDAALFAVKMHWINPQHTEQFKTTLIWLTTATCFQGTACNPLIPPSLRPCFSLLCSPLVIAVLRRRANFLPAWFANTTTLINGGVMMFGYFKKASSKEEEEGGKVSQFFSELLWYQTTILFVDLLAKKLFSVSAEDPRRKRPAINEERSREIVRELVVVAEKESEELQRITQARDALKKGCLRIWKIIEEDRDLHALFKQCQNATKELLLPPPNPVDRAPLIKDPAIEAQRIAEQECLYWENCKTRIIDFLDKNPGFKEAFLKKIQTNFPTDAPVNALLGTQGT